MLGPSISVDDVLFVSPMWHFVRTTRLPDEVEVNEPLPVGVTELPLVKDVQSRFGVALTLRVR